MQNPNKSTHTQAGGGKTSENGNLFTHTQSFPRELDERFNSPTFWSEVFFFVIFILHGGELLSFDLQ